MINNIIFDLGGVIVTIDQKQAVSRFKEIGVTDAEKRLDPYTQFGIFGDLEKGKIDADTFRKELSKIVGRELTFDECKYAWLGYRKELPKRNLEVLKKLKSEGYRIILLSNTNPYMMSWADSEDFDGEGHPLSYYFDSSYRSYDVNKMKPDEMFFRYVLSKEHILPEDTLFVDDGPRNVAAASELGMHTFCPKNGEDWTSEIYEYLNK
jgi:FMN phosphatase YigB (HAD superfamily)